MHTNTYLIEKVLRGHIAITILMTLTATLSMVINGLVVGQMLGPDSLVAFGLSSPMFILLSAVSGVFSNGGSIRCAKHIGSGRTDLVRMNFTVATVANLITAAVFTVVCLVLADPLAMLFGAKGEIADITAQYIRGIGLSAIPFLLLQNVLQYLRLDNGQRISLASMITVIVVNTGFAVYSSACTDLGLFGIGLAMCVGNLAGLIVTIPHFRISDRIMKFSPLKGYRQELGDICMAGLPTAINRGSQTIKNFVLNTFLLSVGGSAAVLALSVQTNVYQFLIAISTGYGLMVAMMCGMFFGEKDKGAIVNALRTSIRSGVILSSVVAVILFVFAEPIAALFLKSGGDLEMATRCLRIFAFSQPTSTLCLCFLYMYQTMGNLLLSNIVSLTRGALYVILVSFVLTPLIGLDAVWLSFLLADVLSVLTIMVVVWRKTGRFPRCIEDFVVSEEGAFDVEVIYETSISNDMSEVDGLTESIASVCIGKGVEPDKAQRIALCIEEMAGNVVEFAFTDDKVHFIDIRIVRQGDDVTFRMRDDGIRFNPITADTEGHLGIKVVRAAAKSVDYRYSVNLNNLTVTV